MEKLLQELLEKVEELRLNQELILSRLDDSVLYRKLKPQPASDKKKTIKEREEKMKEEFMAVIINGPLLREKFNLAVTPQSHRILAYLRTGNAAAFDGLKRKN